MRRSTGLMVVLAVTFATEAFAQGQGQPQTKLRLLCDGVRESGDDPSKMKKESVTIQLEIFPDGQANVSNLTLRTYLHSDEMKRGPVRFKVDAEEILYDRVYKSDNVTYLSKFSIDRF